MYDRVKRDKSRSTHAIIIKNSECDMYNRRRGWTADRESKSRKEAENHARKKSNKKTIYDCGMRKFQIKYCSFLLIKFEIGNKPKNASLLIGTHRRSITVSHQNQNEESVYFLQLTLVNHSDIRIVHHYPMSSYLRMDVIVVVLFYFQT